MFTQIKFEKIKKISTLVPRQRRYIRSRISGEIRHLHRAGAELICNRRQKLIMKKYSLNQVKDQYLGVRGIEKREEYELELKVELIGQMIKEVRKKRELTQSELGELIGVKKAQISRLENNTSNVSIGTIIKVFNALKAEVKFHVSLNNDKNLVLT